MSEQPTCQAITRATGLGYKPPGSSGAMISGHVCGRKATYRADVPGHDPKFRCTQHAVRDDWVKWMGCSTDGMGRSEYLIVWAGVVTKIQNRKRADEVSSLRE